MGFINHAWFIKLAIVFTCFPQKSSHSCFISQVLVVSRTFVSLTPRRLRCWEDSCGHEKGLGSRQVRGTGCLGPACTLVLGISGCSGLARTLVPQLCWVCREGAGRACGLLVAAHLGAYNIAVIFLPLLVTGIPHGTRWVLYLFIFI